MAPKRQNTTARATRHVRGAASATAGAARSTGRYVRKVTHASGAGRTGLGNLIELSAVNSAGDALLAVALAGSLFFGLPVDEARGRVALYLLITVAPFAIIAPVVGPALDRLRSARRFAIGATMLARGLLCWGMAGAVLHNDAVTLLPAAFAVLILSKAFGISRSAVTPRVLPGEITLVTANARCTLAGLIAAAAAAGVGAGVYAISGPDWTLRVATVVFCLGMVLAIRMPKHVDDPEPVEEPEAADVPDAKQAEPAGGTRPYTQPMAGPAEPETESGRTGKGARRRRWRTLVSVGPVVGEAVEANAAIRVFSGFMVLFCAFLLREHPFGGVSPQVALGVLAVAAGAGGLVGTSLGAALKARAPHVIIFATLGAAAVAAALGAAFFGLVVVGLASFVAAFAQSLGKLGMDAIVQREIGAEVRSSTFAVSETLHQLAWVAGGLAGLALSLTHNGVLAFALIAAVLVISVGALLVRRAGRRRAWRAEGRIAGQHT
ncbi:MAG TPA: MFS transporter [Streptosporangiaceae bacterium]|jgi:MFS family permease